MRSRAGALLLSVAIAVLVYYALYRVAPNILIFQPDTAAAALVKRYKIDIVEDAQEHRTAAYVQDASGLGSRPGSVRDLVERDMTDLADVSIPPPSSSLMAEAQEKVSSDAFSRDHDLTPGEDRLKRMEARILEIESTVARQDVSVARRLVRPSTGETLPTDALPVLRGPTEDAPRPYEIAIPASRLLEGATPKEAEGADVPTAEPPAVLSPIDEMEAPRLPVEILNARAPIQEEQRRAREESAYTFLDDLVDVELTTFRGRPGEQGFFRVRILPKGEGAFRPLPKVVYYVIDASSSIHPRKLTLSARGVLDALPQLRSEDRFNIVLFRDSPRFLMQQPVAPTAENIEAARTFLSDLEARGETDVFQALQPVLQTALDPGTSGIVMVLSDGRPTTGLQDGRAIINGLTADNRHGYGIYAFGGGNTVNRPLLDMLAYRNAGTTEVVEDMGDMQRDLPPFAAQFDTPLLTRCRAAYAGGGVGEVYPVRLPDFFRGRVVTLYGRYDTEQADTFVMRLTGRTREAVQEVVFRANLADAESGTEAMARQWAVQKAYHLVGRISQEGEQPGLMAELRVLRERYDVRTTYHP